jgi:hypothetical protein
MTVTGSAAATVTVSSTQGLVPQRSNLHQAQLCTVLVRTAAAAGSSSRPQTVSLDQPTGRQLFYTLLVCRGTQTEHCGNEELWLPWILHDQCLL